MINSIYSTLCVDNPEIKEVLDLESGEILLVQDAIGDDYSKLEKLRMALAESVANDRPIYACPICGVGVYLVCHRHNNEKRFFFRHRLEDGNCPAITRSDLSKKEIEARKYNGVKESAAHLRMKEMVAKSLARDPDFSDIKIETVWKGQERASWRKPDVRALWRGKLSVAFEIQLSTTFLHVIAERRLFYKVEGGLLCWIFRSFDAISARMMQDDVFFNNNHNLFLVSEETLKISKEQNALVLDCHWTEPVAESGQVIDKWNGRFVPFSELTQDLEQQRIYLFDYDGQREQLVANADADALKHRFEVWWADSNYSNPSDKAWNAFCNEFKRYGVTLPQYQREVSGLLNALYTAKAGKVIGWKHPKLISAAHTVAGRHKNVLRSFRSALLVYNRANQIEAEDENGKWAKKVKAYKQHLKDGDPAYDRERKLDPLIALLFPEVWKKIGEQDSKVG
jgi:hypothetical protein